MSSLFGRCGAHGKYTLFTLSRIRLETQTGLFGLMKKIKNMYVRESAQVLQTRSIFGINAYSTLNALAINRLGRYPAQIDCDNPKLTR
jgi:hypothetical protein